MSSSHADNVDRGLSQPARKPVLPADNQAIDRWINQWRQKIAAVLLEIENRQKISPTRDPSEGQISQLNANTDKLYALTLHKIRNMKRPSTVDFNKVLELVGFLQSVPFVSQTDKDAKTTKILELMREKIKPFIEEYLDRYRRTEDIQWHQMAQKVVGTMQVLGIGEIKIKDKEGNLINADDLLMKLWEEYQQNLIKQPTSAEEKTEQEQVDQEMVRLIPKSYGRIQKKLGDPIFVKRRARGTHDPGTSGRYK